MLIGPLKLKAQIYCGGEIAMGPGKADLLEAIARDGSISGAGRALGMSYRRAWLLVDAMNRCWAQRLVETSPGGARNRGARLTDFGAHILALYRAIERDMDKALEGGPLAELQTLLRTAPEPPHYSARPHAESGKA
ncbi:MAG: ModE family transcriptional regulator [Sphingomonas sanxanigenens]|uniref:ModE family transcriptional regulator n=1 Tax=Sphingomonas sanxanigenens TaxID=397260 RepID=A0A2W5A3R1_9SPHN|nr:MAG: ModE family transcriptional regulator [Sphingomonas sanxanigenens]